MVSTVDRPAGEEGLGSLGRGWRLTYSAVEKRMNGAESEKACAWPAAQASNVAAMERCIVAVMPSAGLASGRFCRWRCDASRSWLRELWLAWMMHRGANGCRWAVGNGRTPISCAGCKGV